MQKFSEVEIMAALTGLPGWSLQDGKLFREYLFLSFMEALAFVNRVAALAEKRDHHPDIDIRYKRVVLSLVTHDANGVSQRDVAFASSLKGQEDSAVSIIS